MLDSSSVVPDLPQPHLLVWPIVALPAVQQDGGAGQSRGCRDEERISSEEEEDDGRLLPLPSGLAAEESRLILSSVDGGNPARAKKWLLSHFTYIKWDQCRRFGGVPFDCLAGFTAR